MAEWEPDRMAREAVRRAIAETTVNGYPLSYVLKLASKFADVVNERPRKKWLAFGGGLAECPHCHYRFHGVYDDDNADHYCRYCGEPLDGITPKPES